MSSTPSNTHACAKVCGIPARPFIYFLVLGGSLALLIWAKLRLVTTVPRTAYAVPEQVEATANPASSANGGH